MADTKISALTTDSAPDRTADYVPTYDASAGATKKVLLGNLGAYVIPAEVWNVAPADAQTYYFGAFPTAALTTSATNRPVYINRAGIITRAKAIWLATGGTAENSTMYFRLNNTTDTTLSSTIQIAAGGNATVTGLSIAVAVGDYFEIKWACPTWATNPTAVYIYWQFLVE